MAAPGSERGFGRREALGGSLVEWSQADPRSHGGENPSSLAATRTAGNRWAVVSGTRRPHR
jgi:hypothetical protein